MNIETTSPTPNRAPANIVTESPPCSMALAAHQAQAARLVLAMLLMKSGVSCG